MSNIIVVTGGTNTGKSELLTKLYETILRWYDNYELTIEKQPINSFGDFLADITIKINKPLKDANEKKYPNDINTNNEEDCCKNNPQQNDKKDSIRILINTAGDEIGNFTLLEGAITTDFDFLIFSKRDRMKGGKKLSSDLQSHIKKGKKKSNNHHNEREKNLMCIIKEIVFYIYNNLN